DRLVLVDQLLAERLGLPGVDGEVAGQGDLGQLERRHVQVDLALRLVELGLVRPRVDHEEQVPLLDLGPLRERHLHQVAGDPGAGGGVSTGGPAWAGRGNATWSAPPRTTGGEIGTAGGAGGATAARLGWQRAAASSQQDASRDKRGWGRRSIGASWGGAG